MATRAEIRRFVARRGVLLAMLCAIGLVLAGAAWSAAVERHASLDDFSRRQALLAAAVAMDFENRLAEHEPTHDEVVGLLAGARQLEQDHEALVLVARPNTPGFVTSDRRVIPSSHLRSALDSGVDNVVIPRDEAAVFGLPRRTAIAGLARVAARDGAPWGIVVVSTAERVRDRQIHEQWRIAITVLLVTGVAVAFSAVERRRQRSELEREREAALAKAEKMAALAALSSGIAHEIGTPLGVIVGRVEQVQDRTDDPRSKAALDLVLEQVERMRGIVRGCLALARGEAPLLVKTRPRELAERALALVSHRFDKAGVAISADIDGDLPLVSCDPPLFEQALVNVLLNACEATPRGGRVHLGLRATDEKVEFVVDDDGAGIPEEVAKRATEPFFSTRRGEGGSGLGLTIAREIVTHHAGAITLARRADGVGTRATISITT